MAVVFANSATNSGTSSATSISLTYTPVGDFIIFAVGFRHSTRLISSISYVTGLGTLTPTLLVGPTSRLEYNGYLYYLATSLPGTLNVNFTGGVSDRLVVGCDFTGVDSGSPVVDSGDETGISSAMEITVAGVVGGLVVDFLYMNNASLVSLTPGAGQTVRVSSSLSQALARMSTKDGATSVTMQWVRDPTSTQWVLLATSLRGGAVPPPAPTGQKQQLIL